MKRKPLEAILGLHRAVHRLGLLLDSLPHARITQAEAFILAYLHDRQDATIAQLHRAFGHRRSTLTAVIDRLVQRGLATRETSPEDRRSFVVSLSARGAAVARRVHNALAAVENTAFRGMSEDDATSFGRILARLSDAGKKTSKP